jgi:hypothetical protein
MLYQPGLHLDGRLGFQQHLSPHLAIALPETQSCNFLSARESV